MKLFTVILGFIIFAISLPSASNTAAPNSARVEYFDRMVKIIAVSCEIPEAKKVLFVNQYEPTHLRFNGQAFVALSEKEYDVRNKIHTYCNAQSFASLSDANNAAIVESQISQGQAGLNAANARRNLGAPTPGSRPGAGAGGAGAGAGDIGLMRELVGAAKDARGPTTGGKDGKPSGDSRSASTGESGTRTTSNNSGGSNAGSSGQNSSQPGTAPAQGAGVGGSIQSMIDNANGLYSGRIVDKVIPAGNGSSLNVTDRTVNIAGSKEGEFITLKYDKTTGKFTSADGSTSMSPETLTQEMSTCTGECSDALKSFSADPKTAADAGTISSVGNTAADAAGQAEAQSSTAAGQAFSAKITSQSAGLSGTVCALGRTPIVAAAEKYGAQVGSCGTWGGRADTFCSTMRSPKAKVVQRFMTLGTAIIARTSSASEGCSAAQKYSAIAQQGMTVANLACTGLMYSCEFTCGTAETNLQTVGTTIEAQYATCKTNLANLLAQAKATCASTMGAGCAALKEAARQMTAANTAYSGMVATYKAENGLPTTPKKTLAKCAAYEADVLDMALQVLGAMDAAKQAKACKKALGDGEGGGGGGNNADNSMEEFCKVPGQAQVPPCKCRVEPTAVGCPGHVANNINNNNNNNNNNAANKPNGSGVNTTNNGGLAEITAPGGIGGSQSGLNKPGGLSEAAKAALGLDESSGALGAEEAGSEAGAAGGVAGAADSSGGGGLGGANGKLGKNGALGETAKKDGDGKKVNFGRFDEMPSFGSLKFGPDGKTTINGRQYTKEEIKVMAQRKIASEEFFQQVTTASGKSNWDKVRVRYDENRGSLYSNP